MKLKRLKQDKKDSHVGMILSFVIFVTFLIYIFSILEPVIQTGPPKTDSLEILKKEVLPEVESKLITITYKLNLSEESEGEGCLKIPLREDYSNLNVSVFDMSGNIINSFKQDNCSVFENTEDEFIKLKHLDSIVSYNTLECSAEELFEDEYKVQSIKTKEYVFESKVLELFKEYKNNYTNLKNLLGVATGDDFAIDFEYENKTIISSRQEFPDKNIYVNSVPVQYVNMKTELKLGNLKIKIW